MAVRIKIPALLTLFMLVSCGTLSIHKTSDFKKLSSRYQLNKVYYSEGENSKKNIMEWQMHSISLLRLFNIYDHDADFISLYFEGENKLLLDYIIIQEGVVTVKHEEFTGKWKKNFFEVYLSKKQFFIPLLYGRFDIDRLRIGVNDKGNLFIRNFYDRSGYITGFAAGNSAENPYYFITQQQYTGLMPYNDNGLWGYKNNEGKIIIAPQYNFARTFEYDAARVILNGKWGLIDTLGAVLAAPQYDSISKPNAMSLPPVYVVSKNNKLGLADAKGKIICAVQYDEISGGYKNYFSTKLGDKYGIASRQKTIVPALYDRVGIYDDKGFFTVFKNKKEYLVDTLGYEYDIIPPPKRRFIDFSPYYGKVPDISTRRIAN
ncbi:WG repeat-containing protein [Flavobacterium rhizosphaerae]|uniref:WG repeat-containing protein n=1 Tax=Flavobacterium rhizosphaerae TaxID=3163298 RepID=A0ABW8YUX1_9FLAO